MKNKFKPSRRFLVRRKEAAAAVRTEEASDALTPKDQSSAWSIAFVSYDESEATPFRRKEAAAAVQKEEASDEGEATPSPPPSPPPLVRQRPPVRIGSEANEIEMFMLFRPPSAEPSTTEGSSEEMDIAGGSTHGGSVGPTASKKMLRAKLNQALAKHRIEATADTMIVASGRRGADWSPDLINATAKSPRADLYELLRDMMCQCDHSEHVPNVEEEQESGGVGSESSSEERAADVSSVATVGEDVLSAIAKDPAHAENEEVGMGGRYSKFALDESEYGVTYDSVSTLPASNTRFPGAPPSPPGAAGQWRRIPSELLPQEGIKRGGPLKKLFFSDAVPLECAESGSSVSTDDDSPSPLWVAVKTRRVHPLRKLFVCDTNPLDAWFDPPILVESGSEGSVSTDECSTLSGESTVVDDEGLRISSFATQQQRWEEESTSDCVIM